MSDQVQGVDMETPCPSSEAAQCLATIGKAFVGRYYSWVNPGKVLTAAEAQLICGAGLEIVSLYEDDGTTFNAALGMANAATALKQAGDSGQPQLSSIYFAVDHDASVTDITNNIAPYFASVCEILEDQYAVGVYGSGLVCGFLLSVGLATSAWLSMSTGYRGSNGFDRWSIRQYPTTTCCNLSVDIDVAVQPFGSWTPI